MCIYLSRESQPRFAECSGANMVTFFEEGQCEEATEERREGEVKERIASCVSFFIGGLLPVLIWSLCFIRLFCGFESAVSA